MKRESTDSKLEASPLKDVEAQAALEPKSFDAQVKLGDAYYDLQQHEKALAAYQRALAIGDSAYVRTNLGVLLHTLQRTDEALEQFARASEIDPAYWKPSFNELVIFANRKEYAKALARIDRLRSLQQTNSEIPPLDDLEQHLRARAAQLKSE
jgi:tetratricopeptide (TPR) repeat protein